MGSGSGADDTIGRTAQLQRKTVSDTWQAASRSIVTSSQLDLDN